MESVYAIGIFLAFFIMFLLLTKRGKDLSDNVLMVWMFFIGLHLASYHAYSVGLWDRFPHLVGTGHPLPYVHGPMLYLYVACSLRSSQRLVWTDFLHFLPFVLTYAAMMPFFFGYTAAEKHAIDMGAPCVYDGFMMASVVGFLASGLTYSIVSYRLLLRRRRIIDNNFSADDRIRLTWLRYCIVGVWAIYGISTVVYSIFDVGQIVGGFNVDVIAYLILIVFVALIGFFGVRYRGIFVSGTAAIVAEAPPAPEYRKSGLRDDAAEELAARLLRVMQTDRPYLDPRLSLSALAAQMDVSPNILSQVINQRIGRNFSDFVNAYRVDEFKRNMASPRFAGFSIMAVAFESGFNSKTSFNTAFKKLTGITPSQFARSAAGSPVQVDE